MTRHQASYLTDDTAFALTMDTDPWLSCDACFDEIDAYIDRLIDGDGDMSPGLRAHLIGCGACLEEAWSLLVLAAQEYGRDPHAALAELRRRVDCEALAWPTPSEAIVGSGHK